MSLALPGSRALLVGCGSFESPNLPNLHSAERSMEDLRSTLIYRCGMAPENVATTANPSNVSELGLAVAELSGQATDVLFFYYVGHGLVSSDGDLHLSCSGTDPRPTHLPYSSVRYRTIQASLSNSIARSIVVILDCCFAGRAVNTLASYEAEDQAADLAMVQGGCVLAAAARDELALAPLDGIHTAFTGELIEYLNDGDPGGPAHLTLRDVFRHLALRLPAKGFPLPRRRVSEDVDNLVLAGNPRFLLNASVTSGGGGRAVPRGWQGKSLSENSQRGNLRVHEIARDLGVSSKDVLAALSDIGEFVKSASSTVEAPVARDVRAHIVQKRATASRSGSLRIYALAKEVGVSAERIVAALSGVGVYGKNKDSLIEAPEARWVRHHFQAGRGEAGKVRVHELAKELGLTSKEVLSGMKDIGEFVKSASSTLSPPVEQQLRYHFSGPERAKRRKQESAAMDVPFL